MAGLRNPFLTLIKQNPAVAIAAGIAAGIVPAVGAAVIGPLGAAYAIKKLQEKPQDEGQDDNTVLYILGGAVAGIALTAIIARKVIK